MNPYSSPQSSGSETKSNINEDLAGNVNFCRLLATTVAFFCVVFACHSIYATFRDFDYLSEFTDVWSPLHSLTCVRALLIPVLITFAALSWRFARMLRSFDTSQTEKTQSDLNDLFKSLAWLLVGVMLFAIYTLIEVGSRYLIDGLGLPFA